MLAPGTRLGPYALDGLLGRGGMGSVYRARRLADDAPLALKVLEAPTADRWLRFEREAQLAARLDHPGIVRVHAASIEQGKAVIAMDLIEGEPLAAKVGRLDPRTATGLVAQVARAVAHAHAHGVLHRDLKPANVLVTPEGRAKVTDFGLARALDDASALTRTGVLLGTPVYLSPEQAAGGRAGPPSDVHALGVLLFEALTGRPPFVDDELMPLLVAIGGQTPPRPSTLVGQRLPAGLDEACLSALAKDPTRRPTAEALAARLEAVLAGRGGARRLPLAVAGAAAALVLAAAWLTGIGREPTPAGPPPAGEAPPTSPRATLPPPAPAREPAWLRLLEARGDLDALRAAEDDPLDLDPAHRARALAALVRLDAAWRDPGYDPPGAIVDEHERLLLIHAVALRLDPGRSTPARREQLRASAALAYSQPLELTRNLRLARAAIRVVPRDLAGYMLLSETIRSWLDPRLEAELRVGIGLAAEQGERGGAGQLTHALVAQLCHVAERDPARAIEAREEALRLVAAARDGRPPMERDEVPKIHHTLAQMLVAVDLDRAVAEMDAIAALDPDLEVLYRTLTLHAKRLQRTGDPAHARSAQALAERTLKEAERRGDWPDGVETAAEAVSNVLGAVNGPGPAAAACERLLAAHPREPLVRTALLGVSWRCLSVEAEDGALVALIRDCEERVRRSPQPLPAEVPARLRLLADGLERGTITRDHVRADLDQLKSALSARGM